MNEKKSVIPQYYLVYFFIFLYVVVNLLYGFSEEATWDDDCPVRFNNTLNAFNDPKQFINVWNRPLFVVLFAPIVHLGRDSVFISMVLITAVSAYFLYKGIEKKGYNNSYMILPLLLFQTYFFSISRNAETEPLAVALICFGYYFLVNKKWAWFALIGGLLPLARLELSVLLAFWGWYLLVNKQFKYIPLFLLPLFLWNLAGYFIEGDLNYVYNTTLGQDNESNRYGHTSFGHYFQRYIYVLGPTVYFFFILGIVNRIRKFNLDFFIFLQFIAGFMLYVVFSWKLNMGNAAGFLRNLIPLTPLVAILALEGYNFLEAVVKTYFDIGNVKEAPSTINEIKEISNEEYRKLTAKKQKQYKKEIKRQQETRLKEKRNQTLVLKKQRKNRNKKSLLLFFTITFILVTTFVFHSYQIKSHHVLKEDSNYTNLYWVIALIVILLALYIAFYKRGSKLLIGGGTGVVMLSFTAYTEPPDFNMSAERYTMKEVAKWYNDFNGNPDSTYVNHPWFFWSGRRNPNNGYKLIKIENLKSAVEGEICIYETHYSHRLNGDVPKNWFDNRLDWIELDRYISEGNSFHCVIYQKTDSTLKGAKMKLDSYIISNPNKPLSYFSRGNLQVKSKKLDGALSDFSKSIELDSTNSFSFENRAAVLFQQGKVNASLSDYMKAFDLNGKSYNAIHNAGVCYFKHLNYDSALVCFNKALELKPDLINGLVNKSNILKIQKKREEAMALYTESINKKLNLEKFLLERAQLYYEQKEYENCKKDLTSAININKKNTQAIFMRGVCSQNLGAKEEACKDYSAAMSLGHAQAKNFYFVNCENKAL